LIKQPRQLEIEEILKLLRAEVAKAGSQVAWAKQHGVDRTVVNVVLNRTRKSIPPQILKALRLKKVVIYCLV
jgi:heterodisulfide reductase subunit C